MRLEEDIYSIDRKLLIKASEEISAWVLDRVVKKAKHIRYVRVKDKSFIRDVMRAFKDKRYKTMFSPESINRKILALVKGIYLPEKILSELKSIKKRMPYTYHHILTVTILSTKIALDKNMRNKYNPKVIMRLGLVHDIGKSRISPKILNKRSLLTSRERKILKNHPFIGYILLHYYYGRDHSNYDYASYEHHERLDGSGYPRRLKRINRYAQVLAVVDILDALMSSRPYRRTPYTLRAALDHILDKAKKGKLNKRIVYSLIGYARKDKPALQRLRVAEKKRDKAPPGRSLEDYSRY